jgi:FkbM family methyltransferase
MKLPSPLKRTLAGALRRAGYAIVPAQRYARLAEQAGLGPKPMLLFFLLSDDERQQALSVLDDSESQLGQDFFVLHHLGWKRGGYFVEFGAAGGRALSNTWLLEKRFGWNGILAEPARAWHDELRSSGRNATLEFDCVWSTTGESLTFDETPAPELSRLRASNGTLANARVSRTSYEVTSISLTDMLDRHAAPRDIDYLSIDTEGSEYAILSAFDFERYRVRCITCEHNFTDDRQRQRELLASKGYVRKFAEVSLFDDWYVLE